MRAKYEATIELVGFEAEDDDADMRHALAYDHAETLVEGINANRFGGGPDSSGIGLVLTGVREIHEPGEQVTIRRVRTDNTFPDGAGRWGS